MRFYLLVEVVSAVSMCRFFYSLGLRVSIHIFPKESQSKVNVLYCIEDGHTLNIDKLTILIFSKNTTF